MAIWKFKMYFAGFWKEFFILDGFTDGPNIKPAFLYPYVHYYQFLVKHTIAIWNELLFL